MDFLCFQRSTDFFPDAALQAEAFLEVGHGAKQNVKFLTGDEKTRFDFGEAPTISALDMMTYADDAALLPWVWSNV